MTPGQPRCNRTIIGPALGMLLIASSAWAAPEYLNPTWIWKAHESVEWFAAVGQGANSAILVASRSGRLYVLSAATGSALQPEPIAARPGVRLIESGPSDAAFCFDRQAAYGIELKSDPRLMWCYGRPAEGPEDLAGDPETLTGWILAALTEHAVVLVNRNGRVVALDPTDGRARWELSLGPLSTAVRLHVADDAVTVLWNAGGQVKAAFISVQSPTPTPRIVDLRGPWPLWSTAIPGGLCIVSTAGVEFWSPNGKVYATPFDLPNMRAAAVQVWIPPDHASTVGASALLLVGSGSSPVAYDLQSGQRRWGAPTPESALLSIETLTIAGRYLVAVSKLGPTVYDVATGHVLGACRRVFPNHLLGWHVGACSLYALSLSPGIYVPTVELQRVALVSRECGDLDRPPALPRSWTLVPTGYASQVVWSERQVVTLEIDTLRAYTLP